MKTTLKNEKDRLVLYLNGELDTAASLELEDNFKPLYEADHQDVVLDCKDLEYISSGGLRLFFTVLRSQKAKGQKVIIAHLSDEVMSVFRMAGFDQIYEFE